MNFKEVEVKLKEANIPCVLKEGGDGITIELGRNYPEELVDKISEVLSGFKVTICAESWGGVVVNTVSICGGTKNYPYRHEF